MPSPVAHSLIGLAIGTAWLLPRSPWREWPARLWSLRAPLLLSVFAANAPDLDYLPGIVLGDINAFHHTYTHTAAFVVGMAGLLALVYRLWARPAALAWATGLGASHLVADMLTADFRWPYGVMALWPFSDRYWISPITPFWHLSKSTWSDMVRWHNVQAVGVELLWVMPILLLVLAWKSNVRHRRVGVGLANGRTI